jgi:inorganic triphosphatase YgiF
VIQEREVELKLELDCADVGRFARLEALNGFESAAADQVAVYYDTPKSALRRAGFSLRVRRSGGRFVQTMKLHRPGGGALLDRPEWEQPVDDMAPDLAALEATPLASALSLDKLRKSLAPRFEIRVERRRWTIALRASEIELVLDEGTVVFGKRTEPLCEIELELKKGDEAVLFEMARTLGALVPLRLGVRTKAERGYALRARPSASDASRAVKAEPLALRAEMSMAEAFAAIVHSCLRHFRLNEPLVVRERDAGALHQSRVAMRRLRSALTLFRPALRGGNHDRLRAELRWFSDQLGAARNLDVFSSRLPNRKDGRQSRAEKAVRAILSAERDKAYDRVIAAMDSPRLRALLLDLLTWVETGDWRLGARAKQPIGTFADKQLRRRWKPVRMAGAGLRALEAEPLHRLRIDVKKLRYAGEFFRSLAATEEEADRRGQFIAALEALQEHLGAINDIETAHLLVAGLPLKGPAEQRFADRLTARGGSREKHIEAAQPAFERLAALAADPAAAGLSRAKPLR